MDFSNAEGMAPVPVASKSTSTRRRWNGISLRLTLVLMALVGLGLGFWMHQIRQTRAAIALLRQHHGMYYFDFEYAPDLRFIAHPKSWAPDWLRKLVGDEALHQVSYVRVVDPTFTDADFAILVRQFPRIQTLGVDRAAITDRSLGLLRGNRYLQGLFVKDKGITDTGMDLLDPASLPQLSLVDVRGTQVSAAKAAEVLKILKASEVVKRANSPKRVDEHVVFEGGPLGWFSHPGDTPNPRDDYERGLLAKPTK